MHTQTTRPTPTGHQHAIELRLRGVPATRFTDPLAALDDMAAGMTQPIVEVVQEHTDGSVVVQVGVFSTHPGTSPEEVAAVEGLVAELRFHDESR